MLEPNYSDFFILDKRSAAQSAKTYIAALCSASVRIIGARRAKNDSRAPSFPDGARPHLLDVRCYEAKNDRTASLMASDVGSMTSVKRMGRSSSSARPEGTLEAPVSSAMRRLRAQPVRESISEGRGSASGIP